MSPAPLWNTLFTTRSFSGRTHGTAFAAAAALFIGATAATASPLTFEFSFTGDIEPGTVTGVIEGLVDDLDDQAASSVVVTSASPGDFSSLIGLDFTTQAVLVNSFDVSGGQITRVFFIANTSLEPSLCIGTPAGCFGILSLGDNVSNPTQIINSLLEAPTLTFTNVTETETGPEVIPLPASAVLLLGGLAGFAAFRRRAAKT